MASKYVTKYTSAEHTKLFWTVINENMETIRNAYFWLLRRWPPKSNIDIEDRLHFVITELYRLDKVHRYDPSSNRDIKKYLFQEIEYIMSHEYNNERIQGEREPVVETLGTKYERRTNSDTYDNSEEKFREKLNARENEWLDYSKKGISSADLARKRGVSRTAISKLRKSVQSKYIQFIGEEEFEGSALHRMLRGI